MKKQKKIRCAIYTRKSTEEGLEQEFNTLHAQRESAENYIASQRCEGWVCLPQLYDDGGFTGGNMDRPALNRLLADIDAGEIDCVVVYKVDRLSRSLLDFSRILERFDAKGVSFVSVTQQFNSSTSMGKLTLNILLSFAQFEREVISERTRDKIALARKRGKYTGGRPILGYDIGTEVGKLIVNEIEAQRVRTIFDMYLSIGSVLPVVEQLQRFGWTTKTWVTRKGEVHQGHLFNKASVYSLLSNPLYIGKVRYKDELYDGEHEAIVCEEVFAKAQSLLAENRRDWKLHKPRRFGGILNGILLCKACGCGMSHSFTKKGNKRYRYYVCNNATKSGWKNCPHPSLPAAEIESFILDEIRGIGLDENLIVDVVKRARDSVNQESKAHKLQLKMLGKELARQKHRFSGMPGDSEEADKLREQISITEQSIASANIRLKTIESASFSADDVRGACRKFDPLWETLSNKEQWRMLTALLESVEFDAVTGSVNMNFAPGGVKKMGEERTNTQDNQEVA
jgi:site-specific DNA recombinase